MYKGYPRRFSFPICSIKSLVISDAMYPATREETKIPIWFPRIINATAIPIAEGARA